MAEKLDKTGETLIIRYVDMETKSIPNPTPALGYLLQRVPNQQNATNIHMTKKKKKSLSPTITTTNKTHTLLLTPFTSHSTTTE